jgi:hypothetical protein
MGVITKEVEEILPNIITNDKKGRPKSVFYG